VQYRTELRTCLKTSFCVSSGRSRNATFAFAPVAYESEDAAMDVVAVRALVELVGALRGSTPN
jgi:hypothetical protein